MESPTINFAFYTTNQSNLLIVKVISKVFFILKNMNLTPRRRWCFFIKGTQNHVNVRITYQTLSPQGADRVGLYIAITDEADWSTTENNFFVVI